MVTRPEHPRAPFVGEAHDLTLVIAVEITALSVAVLLFLVPLVVTLYVVEWTTGGIADWIVR